MHGDSLALAVTVLLYHEFSVSVFVTLAGGKAGNWSFHDQTTHRQIHWTHIQIGGIRPHTEKTSD
jgi:hypothetical protein